MNRPLSGVAIAVLLAACSALPTLETRPGAPWSDASGATVGPEVLALYSDDCPGRESAGFLDVRWPTQDVPGVEVEQRRYVRDPENVMPTVHLLAPYDSASSLPREATFTGFSSEQFQLWVGADDDIYVYLVQGTRIEALPRAVDETVPCG